MKKAIAAAVLLSAGAAQAAVQAVDYASLQGSRVDFQSLAVTDPLGSLIDGVLTLGGVQFGERFDGQWLGEYKAPRLDESGKVVGQDLFDELGAGTPTAGLTLLAGAAGANLGAYDYGDADGIALAGIGPSNPGGFESFGLGSISARFATGQSALGFQLREADGGAGWLALYRSDGSLIETVALGALANGHYAYARSAGQADIAGFSLYHRDTYYGIAIDKLVYGSVTAVPEPASVALMLAGLLAVGGAARRRQG